MKKLLLLILLLFFFIMLPLHAIGDTYVTENILQDTTWSIPGSPYIIQNDIQVFPDVTLTIQPGVEVVIHIGSSLIIGGELIARGEEDNLIIFNSNVTIPAEGQPAGIIFEVIADGARYTGGLLPTFFYDNVNREVRLQYESGSIIEYCIFSGLSQALELKDSYPYISKNVFNSCPTGIFIGLEYSSDPRPSFLFIDQNTFENCSWSAIYGDFTRLDFAFLTGNIIRNNGDGRHPWITYLPSRFLFLFNNQIIDNIGTGILNQGDKFMYADNNFINGNNRGIITDNSVLLHNTITNNICPTSGEYNNEEWGAGIYFSNRYPIKAVLFNNTVQLNEVCSDGNGDNIVLPSREESQFTIKYNNIGNSEGDLIDIFLSTNYQSADCDTSSNMVVNATNNFWENRSTDDIPNHIIDKNDDFCAGIVNYQPILSYKPTIVGVSTPPTLMTPESNALRPGTLTLNFSWEPVADATKYLVCTYGEANTTAESFRIQEVQGQTSAEITYSPFTSYSQKYVYWFVVAGNENGWSLPSEIRKVYFSMDPYIVSGKVLDENEVPVPEVYIRGEGEGVFSGDNGNYATIQRDEFKEGLIYSLKKEGFSDCYTFPRLSKSFDTFGNLTIISNAEKDAIYNACGEIPDATKGTIAGIVVDENDQALSGAEVFIEPPSGNIYYLDANNSPDFTLTKTGPSGKFIMLNVAPGYKRISANLNGRDFTIIDNWGEAFIGPGIEVYENSITVDALIDNPKSDDDNVSGSGGGGGSGGGCFIATAAYGSPMEPHVKVLRNFRDRFMINSVVGKAFIDLYNTYSPPVADFITNHDTARLIVLWSLMPFVGMSWMVLNIGLIPTFTIILLMLFLINTSVVVLFRRIGMRTHRT